MEEPVDGGAGQDGQHVLIPSQPSAIRERVDRRASASSFRGSAVTVAEMDARSQVGSRDHSAP